MRHVLHFEATAAGKIAPTLPEKTGSQTTKAVGLKPEFNIEAGATLDTLIGLEIPDLPSNLATTVFAFKTGVGPVYFGDKVTAAKGLATITKAGDPTASDIPAGNWGVWKNSSSGAMKLWANDGGTMKSVALA